MASDPRMKRYFHRSLSLAAIGIATSHVVAWGNDNFILQPKIQSSQAATTEATTQSSSGKPQATASAVAPTAITPASQQISQPASQDQAIRSTNVVAQPSLLQPQSPNAAVVGQANQSNFAQAIAETPPQTSTVAANAGPSWVKRSSREPIVAQSNTSQSNAWQLATRQTGQPASGVSSSAQNAAQPNWSSTHAS